MILLWPWNILTIDRDHRKINTGITRRDHGRKMEVLMLPWTWLHINQLSPVRDIAMIDCEIKIMAAIGLTSWHLSIQSQQK